jgi:phenylpyruvate tautomerase PptA (4-oxalocrotonate tautomerase family)
MPILEVVHAAKEPVTTEQKRAFARSAVEIFRDVLGTPDGRLRVFFYPLEWEDSIAGLLEGDSGESEDNPGTQP